ncbi:AP-1 complex subunit sigma-1 like protein [Verticillium longisporum]|nr:AP-1 complex subunit sigma-1 like protein [Verticillium longisporum]
MAIQYLILLSRQGKVRLAKWFTTLSPKEKAKIKENAGGIHIAGDGMGGRKGTNRDWLYGEDSEPTPKANNGKKQGTSGAQKNSSFNWDF